VRGDGGEQVNAERSVLTSCGCKPVPAVGTMCYSAVQCVMQRHGSISLGPVCLRSVVLCVWCVGVSHVTVRWCELLNPQGSYRLAVPVRACLCAPVCLCLCC